MEMHLTTLCVPWPIGDYSGNYSQDRLARRADNSAGTRDESVFVIACISGAPSSSPSSYIIAW